MTAEKPIPKLLLRPITTGANSALSQSELLAITFNLLKAREKSRVQDAIGFGFGFASHWLKTGARFLSKLLSVAIAIVKIPVATSFWHASRLVWALLVHVSTFTSCRRFTPSDPIQKMILGRFTPPARQNFESNPTTCTRSSYRQSGSTWWGNEWKVSLCS